MVFPCRLGTIALALAACGRIGFDEGVSTEVGEQARSMFDVGEQFACAIRSGDVYCWGERGQGQDGVGSGPPMLVPVRVSGIPDAVQVAVTRYHACLLSTVGTVWCWGGDENGRLGNLPSARRVPGGNATPPAVVPLPERATYIDVAPDHGCAVLASGAVWCWGRNNRSQLGRGFASGESDAGFGPGPVSDLVDAVQVAVDDDTSCALRGDQTVACWGANQDGAIDPSGADATRPVSVDGLAGATTVTIGGDTICALIGGRVGCRGYGLDGQLGDGELESSAAVVLSTLDDYVTVEAAQRHVCAVRENGTAKCWGANNRGVLGDGTIEPRSTPTRVTSLDDAIAISTDDSSTCAARADGSMSCWGWGSRGLIGDGRSAVLRARNVAGVGGATTIAAGQGFSCTSDGSAVSCWGDNHVGQLGLGSAGGVMAMPQPVAFAWPSTITQLVAGIAHVCARLNDDSVYCWGDNAVGQLGDGTDQNRFTPTRVTIPPTTRLAAGDGHTCALGQDQSVRCWGANNAGQVGDSTTTDRGLPVAVATGVAELVTGARHTCIRIGGDVSCWGSNRDGEIGDGSNAEYATSAVTLPGIVASNLAAGGSSSCVRDSAGILCWGLNASNVLSIPVAAYIQPVPAPSDRSELFAIGGTTGCFGDTCWGSNSLGQAGVGLFSDSAPPTVVVDLPAEAGSGSIFAMSSQHACAIVVPLGRTVYCWGENATGEVGIGAVTEARSPSSTVAFP
ncbi:MAG: RCC1 domain-containing protein [Kofleriaceae bacterium]